ncbi:hypothetical protein FB45DRAFT_1002275 [Roridomyces roridus]|uniref:Uncharacterized protein n=1 Tax=Roridomyces roridus TaxID=1738132 RepID=A0AAD7FS85_9AGAR|nr:hypothetical protein FB45DRAFT_1002275 [Roridomyces roridus]
MCVTRILFSSFKPVRYLAAILGVSYSITQLFSEPAQVQFDTPTVVDLPTIFQPPPPPPPPPTRPTASGSPSRTIVVQAPTPQSSLFVKDASPPSPLLATILVCALVILSLLVCVIIWTRSPKPPQVDESAQYDDGEENEIHPDGLEVAATQALNDAPIIEEPIEPDPTIEPPGIKHPVPRPIIVEIIRGTVCFIVSLPVILPGVALLCLLYLIASEHDIKVPPKPNVPDPPPATRTRMRALPGVMSFLKGVFVLFICFAPIAEPRLVLYANAVVHPPALPLQRDGNQPSSELPGVVIVLKALLPYSAPFVESLLPPPAPPPPPPPAPVASYLRPAPPPAPGTLSSPTPTAPDAPQPVTAPPPAPAFSTRHEMGIKLLGILSKAATNRLQRPEDLAGHQERLQHIQQRVFQTVATRATRPMTEHDAEEKDAGHADRLRLTQNRICQTMATRVARTDERIRREKIEEVQRRIRRLFGELGEI